MLVQKILRPVVCILKQIYDHNVAYSLLGLRRRIPKRLDLHSTAVPGTAEEPSQQSALLNSNDRNSKLYLPEPQPTPPSQPNRPPNYERRTTDRATPIVEDVSPWRLSVPETNLPLHLGYSQWNKTSPKSSAMGAFPYPRRNLTHLILICHHCQRCIHGCCSKTGRLAFRNYLPRNQADL